MKRTLMLAALFLALIPAFATKPQKAIVNVSTAFLRAEPDYESPLETQALMGMVVEIDAENRYWRRISCNYPSKVWTNALELTVVSGSQLDEYMQAPKFIVTYPGVEYVLTRPDPSSDRVCDVVEGCVVRDGGRRCSDYAAVVLPDGREGWLPSSCVMSYSKWTAGQEPTGEKIVASAMKFRGVPYMWGGISAKGFDCSGLSGAVYMMNGIILPRNASEQVSCGVEIPLQYRPDRSSDFSALQPGDLLFYGRRETADHPESIGHVAIYIGAGKIIHASQLVRVNSLVPGAADYYDREIIHARRILGHEDEGSPVLRLSPTVIPGTPVE